MRSKIFGGIGVLWGGALLLRWLMSDASQAGSSAYQAGQSTAVIFGAIMFFAGLYTFFRKPK